MTPAPFGISAIIPTRNRAARLERAIESILAQTVPVAEIVIVDDGSEDNTREVVARYEPKARYLHQASKGVAAARNAGVEAATTAWVAFLDDDDEWLPDKIESQVKALSGDADAIGCYAPALIVCDDGVSTDIHMPVSPVDLQRHVLLRNPFTQCSLVMKKAFFRHVGGFNTTLRCGEDWEFCYRAIRREGRFLMIERPLVRVYESANSTSRDVESALESERLVVSMIVAKIPGPMRFVWKLRMNSKVYCRAAVNAKTHNMDYVQYVIRSILYWPSPMFEVRRYKALGLYIIGVVLSMAPWGRRYV